MNIVRPLLYFSVCVLRFFMPQEKIAVSPHPLIPALRRRKHDSSAQNLFDWATSILAFHQSPAAVCEWKVVSIQWFKNKSGLEHEYPIFTLRNESSPDTDLYLRFDRRSSPEALQTKKEEAVVNPDVYANFTQEQKKKVIAAVYQERQSLLEKHLKGIIHASKTSSGKNSGFQPEDTVMRSRQSNGIGNRDSEKVELLATYSNFSCPFPLRDLAIIAQTVVASADAYLLLVQQCYWLTRTMVGISVARYQPQPAEGIQEGCFSRGGRISRLPFIPVINRENTTEITALVERVSLAIKEDDLQVWERYMNGEGGKIAAEEARVAAEEARGVAEEARGVAEKAQGVAEEAHAQAENRIRTLEERLAAYTHLGPLHV